MIMSLKKKGHELVGKLTNAWLGRSAPDTVYFPRPGTRPVTLYIPTLNPYSLAGNTGVAAYQKMSKF